jgi:(2Fe-2S) ferredoxin
MSEPQKGPYRCHVFVCTNDRGGRRKSCADGNSPEVRKRLKQAVAEKGLKPQVRVSQCGCMGLCTDGPNVLLYPQGVWFSGVSEADVERILAVVEDALK